MKETNTWKEKISFKDGDGDAWSGLVSLLEKKEIGLDGNSPIYVKIPEWNGDESDYIEVSNAPIQQKERTRGGNLIVAMKSFKKFAINDLCVGIRVGCNSTHLRVGRLVYAYYTVNEIFKNAAYVLRNEDGKERSYQFIKRITPEQIEEIRRGRKAYLKERNK